METETKAENILNNIEIIAMTLNEVESRTLENNNKTLHVNKSTNSKIASEGDVNENNFIDSEDCTNSQDGVTNPDISLRAGPSLKRDLQSDNDTSGTIAVFSHGESKKRKFVKIYGEHTGPKWYPVRGSLVTRPIITKNLPEVFESLPVHGRPPPGTTLEEFENTKLREFIGNDLSNNEFDQLSRYCSPEHLKTGNELIMISDIPSQGFFPADIAKNLEEIPNVLQEENVNLCIVKKYQIRIEKDVQRHYAKRLKYRGIRFLPPVPSEPDIDTSDETKLLKPGRDMIFKVRIYRPFPASIRERTGRSRHSVFCSDVVLLGRQRLMDLRDRIVCPNDSDMRTDVSAAPAMQLEHQTTAKKLFPSGFLFINNVFYVDTRTGCQDYSEPIRQWAKLRGLGDFPHRDMNVELHELRLQLGHPEVYMHQGNCEHLFTFSEVRLASPRDPLQLTQYPQHTAVSQVHAVYCTTCAEFSAKWIVCGCKLVPFDPAFFCDTCLKLYLYQDGRKICDFSLYAYKGNEINILKPQG